jgi:acetyl esterase/lipase
MKKLYSILSILLFASTVFAQLDTTGGRYCTENFFSAVTVTSNITYGSNTNYQGTPTTLVMDIYQPTGDVAASRGLIVFAHGGSFVGGSRTDQDVTALCTRFAKMGWVTCSIDYRIGFFPYDSAHAVPAVIRATQDMKAAIRFFRKDAATTNTYRIDPTFIIAGGSSAGAFMALHVAYLDRTSEAAPWIQSIITTLGGVDGASGNPGYSNQVNAAIDLCGALGDSTWLEAGNVPLVSMHGTNDATVPYGSAIIYLFNTIPIMRVDGSASVKQRADHVGVLDQFHTWNGADHVPYAGTTATAISYMDSTVEFIRSFLCPIVSAPSILTGVKETIAGHGFSVYPNPSTGQFTVRFAEAVSGRTITVSDLSGRVVEKVQMKGTEYLYSGAKLNAGIYFVKATASNKEEEVQKIIITD